MHSEQDICSGEKVSSEVLVSELTRRDARAMVFHLLYAADSLEYETSLESIADNFSRGFGFVVKSNDAVFKEAHGIIQDRHQLDEEIKPLLEHWKFERLGVCIRLILRLALWELKNTNTEPTIIINEAVELAKCFAEQDAYKFVNGILDEWIKRQKPAEN